MYISRRRYRRRNSIGQRIVIYGLIFALIATLLGFFGSFLVFAWYARDLPSPGKLSQTQSSSTIFYDREEKTLFDMYKDKNRIPVPFSEISDYVKKATIAIEDKNFYRHKGVSESGILRAFLNIIFRGSIQGGSTITQQLIKNVLLGPERSASRKIKEMILALEVERKYTKDQILEMYLNEAPYGGSYWGIGSASVAYFGKQPKDLSLLESAILSGLPQSPTQYSPYIGKSDAWRLRAKDVLRRMREEQYISRDEEKKALAELENYRFKKPNLSIRAPHFVFLVKDQLEKEYGAKFIEQGVKIKTTLSMPIQEAVEKIAREEIEKIKSLNATNTAVVVLDSKTGEILAMVGSYDFNDDAYGKFNAALGLRQPGSTIKPITYAVAFEKGYTPSTVLMDVKTVFPDQGDKEYIPENYDGKYRGPMQIRFALGNSENIPAVKLLAMIGIRDFLQKAADMGLETLAPSEKNLNRFGLSLTLGGGETTLLNLTSAFSVFARAGIKKELSSTLEINDFRGKTLFKNVRTPEKRVVAPEAAFLISHILSDNNARLEVFGPNSYLNIPGKTVAVKTGTTDDKRDNWAIGYTKSITVGVWVGNNDNSPMNPKIASGATGASPIFYRIMREILRTYNDGIPEKPDSVKATTIDAQFGGLPKEGYATRSEYFVEGTEPKEISPFYKKIKISKSTNKLANDIEIKTGNFEEKDFIGISEHDPVSTDGKNRWQEAIDAWQRDQKDERYQPPIELSDASAEDVVVSIKNPSDKQRLNSNTIEVKAKITSVYPLKSVKINLNGSELKSISGNPKDVSETFNLVDNSYTLQVVAVNEKDRQGESTIRFGVNKPWDFATPTPTLTPTPTPTP